MGCGGSKPKANSGSSTSNGNGTAAPVKQAEPEKKSWSKKIEGALDENVQQHYELSEELGRGGFSVVVEAIRKEDGEKYAIKIVEKSVIKDDIKLLKREIDIMKKVDHVNILKLFEIYEDEQHVYIVMELIHGSELFDRIVDKGYYTEKNTVHIVKQILSAVAYLHDLGIAHRDLKPENLLCSGQDEDEVVKIADFGLSKIFTGNELLMTSCGTPGYVAPEVLMCESYDKSVDMWGIGIITYILLAGYPPFYAENDTALFEKIMGAEYDFDDECWDDVSDVAKDFIRNLLVKNPKDRYTAEQALEHEWLTGHASSKKIKAKKNMEKYNQSRKVDKQRRDAAAAGMNDLEDSVGALNQLNEDDS